MTKLESLYLVTITLLIAHQIDSAYWQEWNLFGMSGEIQSFVLSNVPLVFVFVYGLIRLVKAPRVGARFGLALAVVGTAAFFIHAWFLLQGRPEFRVPASIAVLAVALATSIGLGWQSIKTLRAPEVT
jgi:hypothetical protein